MILGFGQPDIDAKNKFKEDLSLYLEKELEVIDFDSLGYSIIRELLDRFSKNLPRHEFNGKMWGHADNIFFVCAQEYGNFILICHGNYSRYNNSHPFSPDGFASVGIPFMVSVLVRKNPEQDYPKDSCLYQKKVEVFRE